MTNPSCEFYGATKKRLFIYSINRHFLKVYLSFNFGRIVSENAHDPYPSQFPETRSIRTEARCPRILLDRFVYTFICHYAPVFCRTHKVVHKIRYIVRCMFIAACTHLRRLSPVLYAEYLGVVVCPRPAGTRQTNLFEQLRGKPREIPHPTAPMLTLQSY